ncbi:MAG: tRNA pseudouridine(54/55) synthase Pus10 [Planctomycetota bacterium]|nr:MAG: tRNA pseudouridine(54/55) synthase Pus10 [Planctomycetota bacterium]
MSDSQPRQAQPRTRLFFEGRYRKLVRGLPQTIFYCPRCKGRGCRNCGRFGKLTKDSVQELIARKILSWFRARKGKFHGAGREDLDVRMLGQGRPFVFEVLGPKRGDVDLGELRDAINRYAEGRIEITALRPVPRQRVAQIKETRSRKIYAALVALAGGSDADPKFATRVAELVGRSIELTQRTPQRVAHRRADIDRKREVLILDAHFEEPERLRIEIDCQHGTYVKEWVSGEQGRTQPSLADLLGCATACVALDVLEVPGPFPEIEGAREGGQAAPSFENPLSDPLSPALAEDPWGLLPENREPEPMGGQLAEKKPASSAPQEEQPGGEEQEGEGQP